MNVRLSSDAQALAESLVAAGRYSSVDEVLHEGIRLLASQERLRQVVEVGIEQADRGEVVDHVSVFAHLRSMAAAQNAKNAR